MLQEVERTQITQRIESKQKNFLIKIQNNEGKDEQKRPQWTKEIDVECNIEFSSNWITEQRKTEKKGARVVNSLPKGCTSLW